MNAISDSNTIPFLDYFSEIKDPRIERGKLYPLNEILLALCAKIYGAVSWNDIQRFGKLKPSFLKKIVTI